MNLKAENSIKRTVTNTLYILKLCVKAEPGYIALIVLDAIRGSVSIFLEHTYGIAFVLTAVENYYSWLRVTRFLLFLIVFIVLGMIFNVFVQQYYAAKNSPFMYQKIKMEIYKKAKNIDLSSYEDPTFYDSYMICIAQIDGQIDKAISLLQGFVSNLTTAILTGAFFVSKDRGVILFVYLSCFLRLWTGKYLGKIRYEIKIDNNKNERKREFLKRMFYLNTYAKEIRLYPSTKEMLLKKFDEACEKCIQVEQKYIKKKFWNSILYSYFSTDFISYVLFVCYMVYRVVVRQSFSIAVFAVLFTSFSKMKTSLLYFTDLYTEAVENSLYIEKIRHFLNTENRVKSINDAKYVGLNTDLAVDNVSFFYGENIKALDNISLTIKKGEKIAIVGYNGAGKTTLVKLLLRLYDAAQGAILVNGNDIRNFDLKSYRHSMGTVFQDYTVFPMTVSENVKMDIVEKTDTEAIDASLEASNLLDVVEKLPLGKETTMTKEFDDNGALFSGGQMQRFAIARTYFLNPDFIIMDEPSSALDPISEYQLNQMMFKLSKEKTVVFISHRLSTVKSADRIIFMDNGKIVEMGTHNELMFAKGKYYELFKKQSSLYLGNAM